MTGLGDAETEVAQTAIRHLRDDGVTFLVIEHILEVIWQLTDRLIVMDDGRIIADGDSRRVRDDRNVLKAYLGEDTSA